MNHMHLQLHIQHNMNCNKIHVSNNNIEKVSLPQIPLTYLS